MPINYETDDPCGFDQRVSDFSPGNGNLNHQLETHGIKANRHKTVTFRLTGQEVYGLCELLRRVAVTSTAYLEVAEAVKLERLLFEQARQQGF